MSDGTCDVFHGDGSPVPIIRTSVPFWHLIIIAQVVKLITT
jgi:hypothetical protein